MRRLITVPCQGALIGATLDVAAGTTALLIVSGGTQIRIGAHRGQATLAARVAAAGYPVLRFDRRGVGDSEGYDPGFHDSGPDIAAAAAALRRLCPQITRIVGFGICDGATALALHHRAAGIEALVLANPWLIEPQAGLPPAAAIRHRYVQRLKRPSEWRRLLTGGVDYRKLVRGVASLARRKRPGLAEEIALALKGSAAPLTLLAAERDATAIAFLAGWRGAGFAPLRARSMVATLDSSAHSFAAPDESAWLTERVIEALARV